MTLDPLEVELQPPDVVAENQSWSSGKATGAFHFNP